MRLRDLFEDPMADYDLSAGPDTDWDHKRPTEPWPSHKAPPKKDTFRSVDRKLIAHPKTRATIEKVLKTHPFNFYFFFVNDPTAVTAVPGDYTGPSDIEWKRFRRMSAEIPNLNTFYGKVENDGEYLQHIHRVMPSIDMNKLEKAANDPKGVVVIHRHNDDDDGFNGTTMPMGAWIILHRTIHVLMGQATAFRTTQAREVASSITNVINQFISDLMTIYHFEVDVDDFASLFLTFRSAEKELANRSEVIVDLFVQYLYQNKITIKRDISASINKMLAAEIAADQERWNELISQFEVELTSLMKKLIEDPSIPGVYIV